MIVFEVLQIGLGPRHLGQPGGTEERDPVERVLELGRHPGGGQQRRGDVDVADEAAINAAGRHPAGPAHHERDVDRVVVRVVLGREPVLTPLVGVVGGEDRHRVRSLAELVEAAHHRRHHVVHRFERAELAGADGGGLLRGHVGVAHPRRFVGAVSLGNGRIAGPFPDIGGCVLGLGLPGLVRCLGGDVEDEGP